MGQCLSNAGVIGLGVMGSALARNILSHGFALSAYSREAAERERFSRLLDGNGSGSWAVFDDLDAFAGSLAKPRLILLLITAGPAVDQVLDALLPRLSPGDVVMDCGNSWYPDTRRRHGRLSGLGLRFLGLGLSGGERGALEGPSVTAGGDPEGWALSSGLWQACAAKAEGAPCCRYVGPDGAGHYVKMVHNGVEYAILQLIAEAYLLMGRLPGWSGGAPADCFGRWRAGKLASYLIDATALVLRKDDGGAPLVDKILDVAGQNGTGLWTALEGLERGVYIPTIYEALAMRSHSARLDLRRKGQASLSLTPVAAKPFTPEDLEDALYAAILCAYSQGFELLHAASRQLGWDIRAADVAGAWKAGCIIRSRMLRRIEKALDDAYQGNLLFSEEFRPLAEEAALRRIAAFAAAAGVSAPAFSASRDYYDACRAGWTPANLIQGLRDHFGAHTFRRTDREGVFHENWE